MRVTIPGLWWHGRIGTTQLSLLQQSMLLASCSLLWGRVGSGKATSLPSNISAQPGLNIVQPSVTLYVWGSEGGSVKGRHNVCDPFFQLSLLKSMLQRKDMIDSSTECSPPMLLFSLWLAQAFHCFLSLQELFLNWGRHRYHDKCSYHLRLINLIQAETDGEYNCRLSSSP